MSRIISLHGRDWTRPDTLTAWQRERAEPDLTPIAAEFSGRWKLATWAASAAVGVAFWTAVACWVLG